jgi:hypothetical protein
MILICYFLRSELPFRTAALKTTLHEDFTREGYLEQRGGNGK